MRESSRLVFIENGDGRTRGTGSKYGWALGGAVHNEFSGMRWYKCDLHMQTPADGLHWEGERAQPDDYEAVAYNYALACYEAGLEVVAITDHNFLSKDFIPLLKRAFRKIKDEAGHEIIAFPGFEFEAAGVGRGVHVLCLFEPERELEEIDHVLTQCGVGFPRVNSGVLAKSSKGLEEILSIVQKPGHNGAVQGLVIMPHVFNDSLFDNNRLSEWVQQDQFRNPNLLAVEVPKPVSHMSEGFQKLFRSGPDCQPEWRREHPMAAVMSSDCKRLLATDEDGNPVPNSIGYRYSWIKMSRPSIESLRQAFLDSESRIRLPDDVIAAESPSKAVGHGWIESLEVRGAAFLGDQIVRFSPHLNCVIGGRGCGKSTILEYMRIALMRDGMAMDHATTERIKRIRKTLANEEAELVITYRSPEGLEERIVWKGDDHTIEGQDVLDLKTYLQSIPVEFFSQQQLSSVTDARSEGTESGAVDRLLALVDRFVARKLEHLERAESDQVSNVHSYLAHERQAATLEDALTQLRQEAAIVERRWRAHSAIQSDVERFEALKKEQRFVASITDEATEKSADLSSALQALVSSIPNWDDASTPHAQRLSKLSTDIGLIVDGFVDTVNASLEGLKESIDSTLARDLSEIKTDLDGAEAAFRGACEAHGLSPEEVGRIQEVADERQGHIERLGALEKKYESALSASSGLAEALEDLYAIWRKQYEARKEAAQLAGSASRLDDENQSLLLVDVAYQQDENHFIELWEQFQPSDRRTRLARHWPELGSRFWEEFVKATAPSPWEVISAQCLDNSVVLSELNLADELANYIQGNLEKWDKLRTTRIRDAADLKLFRRDGSVAGTVAEGTLSDGQRNTAALALLLSQGNGPLIVDQPEDELDSNFLYKELVPMLRSVKNSRQLIFATHNSNLPVNGDSELVYALDAAEGRGQVLAKGGLDRLEVTQAILDIMEGTEEAFKRRRLKYRF